MEKELVLVTGGSGFIAVHIILKLLKRGYRVRTTLRTLSRQDEVKSMLAKGGAVDFENLEFIQTDLTSDINWIEAATDANYVIHVASPTPATRPDDGDEMVKMAVDGTLRVMKAAKAAGVKRVVLTSASGAVLSGHKSHPETFTRKIGLTCQAILMHTNVQKLWQSLQLGNLQRKRILNSQLLILWRSWDLYLDRIFSHSNQIIRAMLNGDMPFLLNIGFDYVDVRDVAELHLLAMTCPEAAGERFIATTGENLTYKEEAKILRRYLGSKAKKVSTKALPDFMIKFMAIFKKDLRMPATFLGQNTACSNAKAKKLLGWQPRSAEEAIVETAKSMIELRLIDK